jgi:ribosomal-protein-alanine N-acetyltransferase
MGSTIRPAVPGDAARLRRLQAELTEAAPKLLAAAIPRSDTSDPKITAATPAEEAFSLLVSVDEADSAVGYLLALTGDTTHIAELAVEPAYRREGRANELLATLIEDGEGPITVHVAVDNTAARELYRTVGFQQQTRNDEQFEHAAGLTLRYPAGER